MRYRFWGLLDSCLAAQDLPAAVQKQLYFVRFEDLVAQPVKVMAHIQDWLGLSIAEIDPGNIAVGVQESDSHYHMKYLHRQFGTITMPSRHDISPRIQAQIESAYSWYYQLYYPQQK